MPEPTDTFRVTVSTPSGLARSKTRLWDRTGFGSQHRLKSLGEAERPSTRGGPISPAPIRQWWLCEHSNDKPMRTSRSPTGTGMVGSTAHSAPSSTASVDSGPLPR